MTGYYEDFFTLREPKKQSQLYSFIVLRVAYCEKEFAKQSQFLQSHMNVCSFLKNTYEKIGVVGA
jgi:hypothetical protein